MIPFFRLYVAGTSARSRQAIVHVEELCREVFRGDCELSVIDIQRYPTLAVMEQVWVTPTLVLERPEPRRRIVGDFGNRSRVVHALQEVLSAAGISLPNGRPARERTKVIRPD
jgi:circadian clock protein KaiB